MRHVSDPRFHVGPMDELYDLVLNMVERRYDTATRAIVVDEPAWERVWSCARVTGSFAPSS